MARQSSTPWPTELHWVLLGLRSVPLETSGVSSAELLYGTPTLLPGQFLSMPEIPPSEFFNELHCLMDPFVSTRLLPLVVSLNKYSVAN